MKIKYRSITDALTSRTSVVVKAEGGRTKQSMKEECDVNKIVARFNKTGLIAHLAKGQPRYLDVSEVADYRTALEHVRSVGEFFSGLPSELRSEFNNDPAEFLDFITDPANVERIEEYGLGSSGRDATERPGASGPGDDGPAATPPPGDKIETKADKASGGEKASEKVKGTE